VHGVGGRCLSFVRFNHLFVSLIKKLGLIFKASNLVISGWFDLSVNQQPIVQCIQQPTFGDLARKRAHSQNQHTWQ